MPDLETMLLRSNDFYKSAERIIYKDYRCNCKKNGKKKTGLLSILQMKMAWRK